jgi:hypothetical protein
VLKYRLNEEGGANYETSESNRGSFTSNCYTWDIRLSKKSPSDHTHVAK